MISYFPLIWNDKFEFCAVLQILVQWFVMFQLQKSHCDSHFSDKIHLSQMNHFYSYKTLCMKFMYIILDRVKKMYLIIFTNIALEHLEFSIN